jgi:hypothetical protein
MKFSLKKTIDAVWMITSIGVTAALMHFTVLKPVLEESTFKVKAAEETTKFFLPASDGDAKAIEGLERFAHEGSMLAYLYLQAIYDKQSLKTAGIDLKEPNPNFAAADLSKSSNIILQAVRHLDDSDLLFVLSGMRAKFDPARQAELLTEKPGESAYEKNRAKLDTLSTFDQPTKDKLLACHQKLEEKLPNNFYKVIYIRSHGACLDNPVQLTPLTYANFISEMINPTIAVKPEDVK